MLLTRSRFLLASLLVSVFPAGLVEAQEPQERTEPVLELRAEDAVRKTFEVAIGTVRVPYEVSAATQPVRDAAGRKVASMFYVYYERTDVEDRANRPLLISFNGGPGSASVWMHLAYTGPRVLAIDDEGYPVQPYGVRENPHSVLDVADILYIDPVNTGFSRMEEGGDRSQFFGVNADIEYLARWIAAFVSAKGRWRSPKFLIGESYGTTRVSGLAGRLQRSHWLYLNGVILVSPTGLGIDREGPVRKALPLPYYAATAWYHGKLGKDEQERDLLDILPDVERFTLQELLPALAQGGNLEPEKRQQIAARVAAYSGISEKVVLEHALAVPTSFFWKELLREEGFTVGRLDSRYRGRDGLGAGERPDLDPALASWGHSFTPAINHYLRDVLGYQTDLEYWIFGDTRPWDREGDETGEQLRLAMTANPSLRVLVQAGYYDGGTDYFSAKYTLWNLDPAGRFQDRMEFKGYRSGHMMYLRREDLKRSNEDVREFLKAAVPGRKVPIKH